MDSEDCFMIALELILLSAAISLMLPLAIAILRIALGPTIADRVISLDVATTIVVCALILLAAYYRHSIFVDVAIVYSIFSFGSTLYFANYMVKK
ncbi:MAG: monovalent cation/H+ antiporter complex subunit F [Candidatus Diapherotrites archaeon]|nr:monovalent cation/H+ antiporter complex subunit F [Candidatus Diapherotrites archaeon]